MVSVAGDVVVDESPLDEDFLSVVASFDVSGLAWCLTSTITRCLPVP